MQQKGDSNEENIYAFTRDRRFYSAYAACGDVSGSGTYNNGVGTNTNPPPNSPPPSNPNASPALTPTPSSVPGDNDGLGNGGIHKGLVLIKVAVTAQPIKFERSLDGAKA